MQNKRYVVTENFKIRGQADKKYELGDSEFFIDFGKPKTIDIGKATELITVNKLGVSKKLNQHEMIKKIEEIVSKKYNKVVSSQNENLSIARKAVKDGKESDKSDDDILIEIVAQGVPFKNAVAVFKKALEAEGYIINAKKRKEISNAVLDKVKFKPSEFSDVLKAVDAIREKLPTITDGAAMSCIRAYAKTHKITLPKKLKAPATGGGRQAKVFNWIRTNPDASEKDFTKWAKSEFPNEKAVTFINRMTVIFKLVHEVRQIESK